MQPCIISLRAIIGQPQMSCMVMIMGKTMLLNQKNLFESQAQLNPEISELAQSQ